MKTRRIPLIQILAVLLSTSVGLFAEGNPSTKLTPGKPLKIFILAGQSNMTGMAENKTLEAMGLDPKTAPMLKDLLDKDGNPVVCDEVYICTPSKGVSGDKNYREEMMGKLTAGYGGSESKLGPEFGFGIYAHKLLGEPVLIIKTARGGRDLFNQFRPPSAGPIPPADEETLARLKAKGMDLEEEKTRRLNKDGGFEYRWMMSYVKNVLADPKRVYPDYDAEAGYELAGFAWFQGYNDFIGGNYPYADPNAAKGGEKDYSEYTRLLGCFIRDIRKELNAPKLPFVIGVFGMDGKEPNNVNISAFRKAQAATAEFPEFKGNVVNVFTENYWPEEISKIMNEFNSLMQTKGKAPLEGAALKAWEAYRANKLLLDGKAGEGKSEADFGLPVPKNEKTGEPLAGKALFQHRFRANKELRDHFLVTHFGAESAKLLDVGMSNQSYHYWGSAKFYTLAGKAFAEALIDVKGK